MSLIRKQEIFGLENNGKMEKEGIELLAGTYLVDDLISILKLNNPTLKKKSLITFDTNILCILVNKSDALRKIKDKYKFISINIYPESLIKAIQQPNNYHKINRSLKKLAELVNTIEIIENGIDARKLVYKEKEVLEKVNKLGYKIALDDVSIHILEDNEKKGLAGNYFFDELGEYIDKGLISILKIDLKLTRLMVEDKKYLEYIFGLIKENINKLDGLEIIFEGIENKEMLDLLKKKILDCSWLDLDRVKIGFQGYYLNRPEEFIYETLSQKAHPFRDGRCH